MEISTTVMKRIKRLRLFAQITDETASEIVRKTLVGWGGHASFNKGEVIVYEGTKAKWLVPVLSGVVSVYEPGASGERHLVRTVETGQLFGATLVTSRMECYPGMAVAATDCEVAFLATDGMIRSRRKVEAIIHNARCFQALRREHGTFSAWIWSFTDGKTVLYDKHGDGIIPASNGLSERVSAELRKRGFKHLGPVTVYSHLQACGIINDHGRDCPRYAVVNAATETVRKRRDHEKGVVDFGK